MDHLFTGSIEWHYDGGDLMVALPLDSNAGDLVDSITHAADSIGATVAGVWVGAGIRSTYILTVRGGSHLVTVPYRGNVIPVGPDAPAVMVCFHCDDIGAVDTETGEWVSCPLCHGEGV